jgi:hypothetical protein
MGKFLRLGLGLPQGMCAQVAPFVEQLFPDVKFKQDDYGNFILEWTDFYKIDPSQVSAAMGEIIACVQSMMINEGGKQ